MTGVQSLSKIAIQVSLMKIYTLLWNVYEKKTTQIIIYISILTYDHSSKQVKYLHIKNSISEVFTWNRKINLNSPTRKFKKIIYAMQL